MISLIFLIQTNIFQMSPCKQFLHKIETYIAYSSGALVFRLLWIFFSKFFVFPLSTYAQFLCHCLRFSFLLKLSSCPYLSFILNEHDISFYWFWISIKTQVTLLIWNVFGNPLDKAVARLSSRYSAMYIFPNLVTWRKNISF